MSDPAKRALRGFLQVATATAIIELAVAFGVDLSTQQQAALIAVLTPILTLCQNLLEDQGTIPTVGKPLQTPEAYGPGQPKEVGS